MHVMNQQSSTCIFTMPLVRRLVITIACKRFQYQSSAQKTKINIVADLLSCLKIAQATEVAHVLRKVRAIVSLN